jgi:PAS domain S-box-containing protein
VVAVVSDISRLRRQQAALAELERERELMFNLSDVGIAYQREGRIERANQAMVELTGYPREQLQGLALSELYEDEALYLQYTAQERRELAQHGRAQGERRLRRRDGSTLWVQVHQRMVDLADPAAGSIASYVNVDERPRARDPADPGRPHPRHPRLGAGGHRHRGARASAMNRSARRMLAGRDLRVPPDGPRRPRLLGGGQCGGDRARERAGGRRRPADLRAAGHRAPPRGREPHRPGPRRPAAHHRDGAAGHCPVRRANQQVLQLNQKLCAFARRPAEAILGRQPALWLPGIEAASLSADLHLASGTQDGAARAAPRGRPRPASRRGLGRAHRLAGLGRRGGGTQLLLVASDVTEQRAAEEARLAAAIAQREMLVKEVHHRIKNNLQGVAGLLQQNAQRHPEASAAIAEAVGHVHAIAQVHGLQVGMTGPLRVKAVMEAIAQSVQRMFGRPITMEVQGPDPHRFALTEADSIPVALTVNELLTNAIKHSAGGAIACRMVCEAGAGAVRGQPGRLGPVSSWPRCPPASPAWAWCGPCCRARAPPSRWRRRGRGGRLRLAPPAVALLTPL